MLNLLKQHYAYHLAQIEDLIIQDILYWQWQVLPEMKELVLDHLKRPGKRLRPLVALIFADLLAGQLDRIYAAAAAVEVYHIATLVYDDIQDNSEFRRGLPCAHVTTNTSTAMNLAAVLRSLMYQYVYHATELTMAERLEVHQRLDRAAVLV